MQATICTALREGNIHRVCAEAAGISIATLQNWIARGRAGDPKYVEFLAEFEQASTSATRMLTDCVTASARSGNWQAAKWMLEVRLPEMRVPKDVVVTTNHAALPNDRRGELCAELARRGEPLNAEQLALAASWNALHEAGA